MLLIQQRVLPAYRAAFFDALADACSGGVSVLAGRPGIEEAIAASERLEKARLTISKEIAPFKASSPLYFLWQTSIRSWLEENNPEVLILEANSRYLSNRFAVRWMHARGKPVLGWGLGAPPISGSGFWAAFRRWERSSYLRLFDGVIAYSRTGAQEYRQARFPAERVWVAPNAASPRPTQPPPVRPDRPGGKTSVLFVGRLQARKRIDNLLHACASLPVPLQPKLVIVGDGPAREELAAAARRIYPQAEFPGARHGSELDAYFREADLFVLPGTGGLAVQQAAAAALPLIVAESDGTQADLVRPENGWLVAPGDADALRDALAEALSDPARLRRMGLASYRIASEEVNLERMVEVFVEAICQIRSK